MKNPVLEKSLFMSQSIVSIQTHPKHFSDARICESGPQKLSTMEEMLLYLK
jgi:hypothetical protein